ncbi:nuclease HARBI1 [Labeo rohita]|uniref:Nuclease HARBI1 n=1 Tax=Labeo rohita TaxID=84645 RepID=A0A498MHB4_LABRO|nr:nuclease HARBI1 [Labeo rohita]
MMMQSFFEAQQKVRLESDHGWERHIEVLVFLYWPAHAASYTVVSQTFDILKTSVHDIVHRVSRAVLGILRKGAEEQPCVHRQPVPTSSGGYPCLSAPICLITPYREPVQNPVQARFNSKHSRAWNIIERAFGMMKTRWRSVFFKALEISPAFVPEVVACCAVLHNLTLLNGDIVEAEDEEDHDDGPPKPHNPQARVGDHIRDNLAAAVSAPNICVAALHEHDYL